MMSETQHVVANLQNSVLFLQQEHARTLHDLHDEINCLQKKCSDQTFQLTLHGLGQSADESPMKRMEEEIAGLRIKYTETRGTLETKEKRVNFLEEQLRSREKRFQDDLKNVSRKVGELELELDNRAGNIAYLTTQLHQAKLINVQHEKGHVTVELQKSPPRVKQQKALRNNTPPPNTVDAARPAYSPSPPQGQPIKSGRRSNMNRRSASSPTATASVVGTISESGSSQQLPAASEIGSAAMSKGSKFGGSARVPKPLALRDDDGPARPAIGVSQARRDRFGHGELRLTNSGVSLHQRRAVAGNGPPLQRPNDYEEMIRISKSTDKSATKIQLAPPSKAEPLPPITTRNGRQLRNNGPAAAPGMPARAARKGLQQTAAANAGSSEIEHLIIEPLAASPEKSFRPTAQKTTK